MTQLSTSTRGLRASAILVSLGAVSSGPAAMLLVSQIAPQPAWRDVQTFADAYRPIQSLPYALGYVLLLGFVLFAAACHAGSRPALRVRTSGSLIFTAIYASLVFTNYTIQLGFIPRVLSSRPHWLAELTMANPSSFAWFLEMFGYAAMGVATWLVAPGFRGSPRAVAIRCLLVINGVVSIVGAACTALFDEWVFSTAGLVSFMAWNLLIPIAFGLIAVAPERDFVGAPAGTDA